MRRNMDRRNNTGNSSGAGPLMTGHLQDIDLELELLKRKREMIEQQQQLLVMEQQFKSGRHYDSFDKPRYNEPEHHGSSRNYSHLYDNGTGPNSRNQFGRKRQPDTQWQYDGSPPKRNRPKRKINQSQFAPRQGYAYGQQEPGNAGPANFRNQKSAFGPSPKAKGPMPLMGVKIGNKPSIGSKIANQKSSPKPNQKDFNPTKVSKPKASTAPNKIASQPLAERNKLVTAAKESASEVDVTRMLLPDRIPTQQVSGRLELALGAIMKNIREIIDIGPHGALLRSFQSQRVMKQAVRERIRTVMLGKVVGSLTEILATYREEFPEETDMDIANIALEASGIPSSERQEKSNFIPSENPVDFFRLNMNCLIDLRLNEMLTNLEDLYAGKTPTIKTEDEMVVDLKQKVEKRNEPRDLEEYKNFLNTDVKPKDFVRSIPRLMKKYIPYLIRILNVDSMYQSTKAAITMKATQKATKIYNNKESGGTQGKGDATNTVVDSNAPKETRPIYNLPYYVKIMGKPSLPKRKIMQTFLYQFNPKSIKKHRTIHNLLFVGFTEKSDFDVMVGADGTKIGKSTLSVRICTNSTNTDQNGELNNTDVSMADSQTGDQKEEPKVEGVIVDPDLDGQINDLLSSIRKEEEDKVMETGENSVDISSEDKEEAVKQANSDVKSEQEEGDVQKEKDNSEVTDNAETAENAPNDDEKVTNVKSEDDNNEAEVNDFSNNVGLEQTEQDNGSLESQVPNWTEPSEVTNEVEDVANNKEENNSEWANDEEDNTEWTNFENVDQKTAENTENVDQKTAENDDQKTAENVDQKTAENVDQETAENVNQKKVEIDNQKTTKNTESPTIVEEPSADDKVAELKTNASGRATPSRTSARLANVTPSTIRTRRASRLTQN